MTDMSCVIAGIHFKNPVIMASGTFGFGREYADYYPTELLGGICGKGLTLHPKEGNPGIRVSETASGMLNSVGLENPGIPTFLEQEGPFWEQLNTVRIANLGGGCLEDYIKGAGLIQADENRRRKLGRSAVDMIELNISCPNVKEGGMAFGIQTEEAQKVVRAVRKVVSMPLIVKLSPGAEKLSEMATMCEVEGADAVSLINTISAMKIDIRLRKSVFRHGYAGLSGPAIKPIALRMVHQVSQAVNIPVIGIGGISSGEDMMEFIMAGAEAVQVGTAGFADLRAGERLINELNHFMVEEKILHLDEVRGIV